MAGLLDIDDVSEEVELSKKRVVTVFGLTIKDIIYMVRTFKPVAALLQRRTSEITGELLMDTGPETIGTIIISGTRERADPKKRIKALERAVDLRASDQLKLINKIFELTFEDGLGPFVQSLWALQTSFGRGSAQPSDAQSEASGKTSPEALHAGLQTDEASMKRYRPRRANSARGPSLSNDAGLAVISKLPTPSEPPSTPATTTT